MEQVKVEPVELKPCPFCGGEAHYIPFTKGKAGFHWPKISCENGHTLRLYEKDCVYPADSIAAKAMLVLAWNQRATPQPAAVDALGEVERVSKAVHEALCRAHVSAYLDMPHGTAEKVATAALSAMSPAGEVEQRGYDRAIAEVVAWLRQQDGYGEWYEVAEQIEAGEHKS